MIPNFFIIGAPKCGTTALSHYLSGHQQIFFSPVKEPHYFAKDLLQFRPYYVHNEKAYLDLFAESNKHHTVVGEASVWYLFSEVAVSNIHQFNSDAQLIVMLRNPIEMVYSLHSQYVFSLVEDEPDFEKAWTLQEARKAGNHLPKNAQKSDRSSELLQYGSVGKFGQQMQRVFDIFPKEQVKVILFDDFKIEAVKIYRDVLAFLNVMDDGRIDFQPINENKTNRLSWLARLTKDLPVPFMNAVHSLGLKNTGILRSISHLNTRKVRRKPLSPDMKKKLNCFFSDDVRLLSQLISRDLDHWLQD